MDWGPDQITNSAPYADLFQLRRVNHNSTVLDPWNTTDGLAQDGIH